MSLPALYKLTNELRAILEAEDLSPEQEEEALTALVPKIESKAVAVSRWIEYQEDLAAAIKAREEMVVAARKKMESRAARWRDYLKRSMESADIGQIVDHETGMKITVRANPPSVEIVDDSLLPAEFWITPAPPPPRPDKQGIARQLKAGKLVGGCRLVKTTRLSIQEG